MSKRAGRTPARETRNLHLEAADQEQNQEQEHEGIDIDASLLGGLQRSHLPYVNLCAGGPK